MGDDLALWIVCLLRGVLGVFFWSLCRYHDGCFCGCCVPDVGSLQAYLFPGFDLVISGFHGSLICDVWVGMLCRLL